MTSKKNAQPGAERKKRAKRPRRPYAPPGIEEIASFDVLAAGCAKSGPTPQCGFVDQGQWKFS